MVQDSFITLRERLLHAIDQRDHAAFLAICSHYQAEVLASFPAWQIVPQSMRGDATAMGQYAQMLMGIASYFQSRGHSELLQALTTPDNNPIPHWQAMTAEAQRLTQEGEFTRSTAVLLAVLKAMVGATGTVIETLYPKIVGLLGVNALNSGDITAAHVYTADALTTCQRTGDREGVCIYDENMKVIRALEGQAGANPTAIHFVQIMERIVRAQRLSDRMQYRASNTLLLDLLNELHQASEVRSAFWGKVNGLLGFNYFQMHDLTQASEYTERALQACQEADDDYGRQIYTLNRERIRAG